jgi:hypothetical protein
LVAAYTLQFLSVIFEKGQSPMGKAFETIGHHAMRKQYDGIPQMRVVRAFAESDQCTFWNFEWTWGRCVGVSLYVRDYRPEHQHIVESQVHRLAEQLRKPCALLPTLGLPNETELARDLGCGPGSKAFKLKIMVTSVSVFSEHVDPANPHMWWAANHKKLYSYHFEGEI